MTTTNNNTTTTTQKNNTDNKTMVLLYFLYLTYKITPIKQILLFNNYFESYSFLLYNKYFYCKRFCSCWMLLLFIVYQIFLFQMLL